MWEVSPRPVSKGHCRYHRCELPRLCSVIARRGCQSADRAAAMKSTNKQREKPPDARCRGLGALSCSDFVEVNRIVWLKCSSRRVLHGQRVWDAAQQVLARQGALYIQRHCLRRRLSEFLFIASENSRNPLFTRYARACVVSTNSRRVHGL